MLLINNREYEFAPFQYYVIQNSKATKCRDLEHIWQKHIQYKPK
jgi:hypothetical protein